MDTDEQLKLNFELKKNLSMTCSSDYI